MWIVEEALQDTPVDEQETEQSRSIRCRACDQELADEDAPFSVAGGTPVRSFVNPAGVVHELITLRDVHDVRDHGPRTGDFTWFPGFTWRFTACGGCGIFLGWCFEAEKPSQDPARFHGLRTVALHRG